MRNGPGKFIFAEELREFLSTIFTITCPQGRCCFFLQMEFGFAGRPAAVGLKATSLIF